MATTRTLLATIALALAGLSAQAGPLPRQATIVYQARLGGLPVGEATQRWTLSQGRYQLSTELKPILGPRIQYLSHGKVGEQGLQPSDYAEFRGNNSEPKTQARFDWAALEVSYGRSEAQQSGKLQPGAQDLNALPFQLSWLAGKPAPSMQIMTGRKLRNDRFSEAAPASLNLMGQNQPARVWIAPEGEESTEIWLAPKLANLPVKIIRHDDKGELQLVAKNIAYQLD